MVAPPAQSVDAQTMLIGTFVLMLVVTAAFLAITYRSLHSEAHTPAGLRETDSGDTG